MDQNQLRDLLQSFIAERAAAGESLADVGRTLAGAINSPVRLNDRGVNPTRPAFSRQYVHMLANGKARITEAIGAAIATLATMQAGTAAIPARAPMTFDPVPGESEIP
jgi:hypothetical protein